MLNKSTIVLISLLTILFTNNINGQTNVFDNQQLATDLEKMAGNLEKSLAVSRSNFPVFDVVKDFGANSTGQVVTTKQLQNAIDSCAKHGPGRVVFPVGVYLTGTLILKSGVHIEIAKDAKILGSTNVSDYIVIKPAYRNNTDLQVDKSLFYAENVDGISFTGEGTIDFQGTSSVYDGTGNNDPRRPFGIRIVSSKNIYMSGIKLVDSPQWMEHYLNCDNLMIENLNVSNHAHKNNDGLDIDGCRNVYVRNSRFDSDDDALCLKSNGPAACENVLVENCVASSHCNALKLGTETTGGFKNIIYRNCRAVQSASPRSHINGVTTTRTAITLIITDGGKMENVWFDNIESTDCITPIFVTLGNRSRKYTSTAPVPPIGSIKNILISNVKASGAGPISSSVTGLNSTNRIDNIAIENVDIELVKPGVTSDISTDMVKLLQAKKSGYPSPDTFGNLPSYGFYYMYVNGLTLNNVKFNLKCNDPREASIVNECVSVVKTSLDANKEANMASIPVIYPNPATGQVTFDAPIEGTGKYQMFDSNGKVILSGIVPSKHFVIEFQNKPQGLYMLRVQFNKQYCVFKVKNIQTN